MALVSGSIDTFVKAQDDYSRLKFNVLGDTVEIVSSGSEDNAIHNHGIIFLDLTKFVVGYRTYDTEQSGARPFLRAGEITPTGINLGDPVRAFSSGVNESVPLVKLDDNNGIVVFETTSGIHLRRFEEDNLDITLLGDSQYDFIDAVIPPRYPDAVFTGHDSSGLSNIVLCYNQPNDSGNPTNNNVKLGFDLIRVNNDNTFTKLYTFNMSNDTNSGYTFGSLDVLEHGVSGVVVVSEVRKFSDVRGRVLLCNLVASQISPITTVGTIAPGALPFKTFQRNTNICRKLNDNKFLCFYANYNEDEGQMGPFFRICSYSGTVITAGDENLWYQNGSPSLSAETVDTSGIIVHRGQDSNPDTHLKFINIDGYDAELYETLESNLDCDINSRYVAIQSSGANYLLGSADVSTSGKISLQHFELGNEILFSKSRDLFVDGYETLDNNIDLFVFNAIINNSIGLYINGLDVKNSSADFFVAGHLSANKSTDNFIYGKDVANNDIALIAVYPSFHQGFENLYIHGSLPFSGSIDTSIVGHQLVDNNCNLFAYGNDLFSDSCQLTIMAGVSFNSTSLYINGTSASNNDDFGLTFEDLLKRADYSPQIIGRFETNPSGVNIEVWNIMDDINNNIPIANSGCYEIGNTDRWGWSTENLPPLTRNINQFVYTMTANTGETFSSEFVLKTSILPIKHTENQEHLRKI